MLNENKINISDFIYPLFVLEGEGIKKEIKSMPDIYQMSIDNILKECEILKKLNIKSIMLFGIPNLKDSIGSDALCEEGLIARTIRAIKKEHNDMLVLSDLCFCEYTDHGHCGIIDDKTKDLDNDKTLKILSKQALIHAKAGSDIIAPSAMIDLMVKSLREDLDKNGFYNIPIMSYSSKFASAYYSPFRELVNSSPSFGDRKTYQLNPANSKEALRESLIDEDEGADILMVKPALAYLDVLSKIRKHSLLPLAVYNVSGEYAILKAAKDIIDYEKVLLENMLSFKRAGADIIISYHAKEIASLLKEVL